jgi:hypothetical protein
MIEAMPLWVGLQPDDRSDAFVGRASARRRSRRQGTRGDRVGLKADPRSQGLGKSGFNPTIEAMHLWVGLQPDGFANRQQAANASG